MGKWEMVDELHSELVTFADPVRRPVSQTDTEKSAP